MYTFLFTLVTSFVYHCMLIEVQWDLPLHEENDAAAL